ncbi:hypothetical protein A606_05445 [Corynebacterium terpenotabidum Y-11]|uniref:DUF952 domain-containing protein n=1 Tax=Corynebacterium terpenotabidum Y-11 TaxID=1200352 RepID=S4XDV7_9CORY|nr:hypothetical protein A606_05445 [Corynebacterium terpenotabidum Y-11]
MRASWDAAVAAGEYRVSTLTQSLDEVGFIHASFAGQVAGTADRFYRDAYDAGEELCVLIIDEDAVRAGGTEIREEAAANGELFPHIYGPVLPDHVSEVRDVTFSSTGEVLF